jgi:Uri superfamily endonuclease
MNAVTSYQLRVEVEAPVRIRVGRLGLFLFPPGRYVYTGSAKRNLEARIARHLRKEKALRWHIDWLLSASGVKVTSVKRSSQDECILNQKTAGIVVVPGFGASDCRMGCGSHLHYLAGGIRSGKPAEGRHLSSVAGRSV